MALAGLQTAKTYEKEALERVRRMSISAADLEVKGPKRGGAGPMLAGINDKWYDGAVRAMYPTVGDDV
jgi:hypothetical protein